MNNNNMINPANYYNPFAKYNYVSKTRGVYIPKDSTPLIGQKTEIQKSSSIYSPDYAPEADINSQFEKEERNAGFLDLFNLFKNIKKAQ